MLVLGVCFRFVNLDRKIYWHDEVYTSLRAAGYTRHEIDTALFRNQFVPAPHLLTFQRPKPDSTIADTVRSLATEDPQHPPLYYSMAYGWMRVLGSSMAASRLLPALLSLLSLPLMYNLAMELFGVRLVALMATTLLALSPFDILFAQTARQYSLLTATVIGSSWLLLRAMRLRAWQHWWLYALSLAAGLYTHPFFGLTMIGHGVYALLLGVFDNEKPIKPDWDETQFSIKPIPTRRSFQVRFRMLFKFLTAWVAAMILYLPWLRVLQEHSGRAFETTNWTQATVGLVYLAKFWVLSFTSLFVDLDFGFNNIETYLLRVPYILLMLGAAVVVCYRTPRKTWLFLLTSVLVPFLILAIPDLLWGGKRSAISRYLISCYPGVQLMVAYLLTAGLSTGKQIWQWLLTLMLAGSIVSCSLSAVAETWWSKNMSYFNADIAHRINADASQASPVLLSDIGDGFTNTGDLISLSYELKSNVRLYLTSQSPKLAPLRDQPNVLAFNPSEKLKAAIAQQHWQLDRVLDQANLWRLKK
jgi:uncharacterized membrane protein